MLSVLAADVQLPEPHNGTESAHDQVVKINKTILYNYPWQKGWVVVEWTVLAL